MGNFYSTTNSLYNTGTIIRDNYSKNRTIYSQINMRFDFDLLIKILKDIDIDRESVKDKIFIEIKNLDNNTLIYNENIELVSLFNADKEIKIKINRKIKSWRIRIYSNEEVEIGLLQICAKLLNVTIHHIIKGKIYTPYTFYNNEIENQLYDISTIGVLILMETIQDFTRISNSDKASEISTDASDIKMKYLNKLKWLKL